MSSPPPFHPPNNDRAPPSSFHFPSQQSKPWLTILKPFTSTESSIGQVAETNLLLGESSLGGDLVDLLLLQLQLGARVAHLEEAAASRELVKIETFKRST